MPDFWCTCLGGATGWTEWVGPQPPTTYTIAVQWHGLLGVKTGGEEAKKCLLPALRFRGHHKWKRHTTSVQVETRHSSEERPSFRLLYRGNWQTTRRWFDATWFTLIFPEQTHPNPVHYTWSWGVFGVSLSVSIETFLTWVELKHLLGRAASSHIVVPDCLELLVERLRRAASCGKHNACNQQTMLPVCCREPLISLRVTDRTTEVWNGSRYFIPRILSRPPKIYFHLFHVQRTAGPLQNEPQGSGGRIQSGRSQELTIYIASQFVSGCLVRLCSV